VQSLDSQLVVEHAGHALLVGTANVPRDGDGDRQITNGESYRSRFQNRECAWRYANRFERGSRAHINEPEQRAVRGIFRTLTGCHRVLDVASGAGRFLATLAQGGREVIEMDIATEMLDLGRERSARLGVPARFVQGDASNTEMPDSSVDVVFCNRLLHHITSARARAVFLREFRRVSRRWVVVSFFDYRAFGSLRSLLKKLKGRKVDYAAQPTLGEFADEAAWCGFRVRDIVPTGPFWVSQKYVVLEKAAAG
jgi:SAM-dependent methyltransferase